jgi:NAD(P)-dependent dehydrogenase (short-subunit alcohol dehydrogenase family)
MSLDGKIAIVTGGSRGIGRAIAETLIGAGASVTIMGRSLKTLQSTAEEIGAKAIVCDVSQADSVIVAFSEIGDVDILVNNAGIAESAPFHRMDLALWERMLSVNLTGTFLCSQQVVKSMSERKFGRIVNIASTAGLTGYAYVSAYCAAKHGVIGLTRALALELARKGITVNAVCPGYTDTDMVAETIANIVEKTGRGEEEALSELVKNNPQGRLVTADEIAKTVLWLCSDGSDAITGQSIAVAGGEIL